MSLNQLKIIAAIIVLILIGLAVERFLIRKESPSPNQTQVEINFRQTGNLVKNNPGLKPNTWYLLYEAAGSPALTKELKFDQEPNFNSGDRVYLEGFEESNVVRVISIREEPEVRTVDLYYYSPEKDKDSSGNILCSRQGLVAVRRQIPLTNTPIQDTIRLLLQGKLTTAERSQGVSTEYPLSGVELKGADLKNQVLTLEFSDPLNKTGGGSCRVGVLWFQIEATAKQFPEVKEVKFKPEELFQP